MENFMKNLNESIRQFNLEDTANDQVPEIERLHRQMRQGIDDFRQELEDLELNTAEWRGNAPAEPIQVRPADIQNLRSVRPLSATRPEQSDTPSSQRIAKR